MIIENASIIVGMIIKVSLVIFLFYISYKLYKLYDNKILNTKNKEIELEKLKILISIDPKLVKTELTNLIKDYTNRYMTKNILANQIIFIKNDQVEEMVKSIIKEVVLDLSPLYLEYCKLLYNVNDEDDLIKVIHKITVDVVLEVVTNYNRPQE